MSNFLWPHELQHIRLLCLSLSPWVCSNSCPLSQWCHTLSSSSYISSYISSSVSPITFCSQFFPAPGSFQWVSSLHQVTKILELQLQHQSFQWIFRVDFLYNWLVWTPCSPRDSQESSPTLQSESINSLPLSLLYGPTLMSIHAYRRNHSFDYTDLCWQSNISAF